MNFEAQYVEDLCTYNCKVYIDSVVLEQDVRQCFVSIDETVLPYYENYPIYEYVPSFNMYVGLTQTDVCDNFFSGICIAPCFSTVLNVSTFPGGGCMLESCGPPQAFLPVAPGAVTGNCVTAKNPTTGACDRMYTIRNGHSGVVTRCDPKLLDKATCQCKQIMPCIMGEVYFSE